MQAERTPTPQPHYTVQEVADALGMGQRALFADLRRRRILDANNLPTVRYKAKGYLVEEEGSFKHPVIGRRVYSRAYITARGLAWLRDLYAASANAHGLIELNEHARIATQHGKQASHTVHLQTRDAQNWLNTHFLAAGTTQKDALQTLASQLETIAKNIRANA